MPGIYELFDIVAVLVIVSLVVKMIKDTISDRREHRQFMENLRRSQHYTSRSDNHDDRF